MKRAAILMAAVACVAAAPNDHAIIQRAFAKGRVAELENDLYNGKAAVYRPIRVPIRISGVAGERCESRLSVDQGVMTLDWRAVRGLEMGEAGGKVLLYLKGGLASDKLILTFETRDEATPVLLAMERLQSSCRPKDLAPWP